MPHKNRKQRGFTLIIYILMLTFMVATAGLAINVGSIYMIKARLSAAVDGAALAAGRSVNLTETVDEATTAAQTAATQFFNANFPAGYMNTLGTPVVNPTFAQESDNNGLPTGVLDITVTASVSAPTYFMQIFCVTNLTCVNSINIGDTGVASRRGVVMMLVLDQSSSMNTAADPISGLTACQAMVQAARNFITLFSPFDYIGMIKFDITAHLAYAPVQTWGDGSLDAAIAAISCGSNTNTISALNLAYTEIRSVGWPLAENTIVLFTDGSPNGVSAAFPIRAIAGQAVGANGDSRWGPALTSPAPPVQPNTSYYDGTASCVDQGPSDANSVNQERICVNMPLVCPAATVGSFVTGTVAQWGDQDSYGSTTYGLAKPTDSDAAPAWPASCTGGSGTGTNVRQYIAYIPDTDKYGNSLHGVAATGAGAPSPYPNSVSGGLVTRDFWLFQTSSLCSPDSNVVPNCKNTGDLWANHTTIGTGSNFFPVGNPYPNANQWSGFFRPDQPNSIVAASMNGTMVQANTIRSDATYHPIINVIYLTGNGTDSVDREFLPIVANYPTIPALPYDAVYVSGQITNLYTNPAYVNTQETGKYFVTADRNQLNSLFAQLASELLRLSK